MRGRRGAVLLHVLFMDAGVVLRLEERDGGWVLAGDAAARFGLVDEYLAHLLDRNYSSKTVRAYGYDLLAFCRWLTGQDLVLDQVTTETLLRFLRACREATVPGRPGPNVLAMNGQRLDRYAATTINRRLAAISGLYTFAGPGRAESSSQGARGTMASRRGEVRAARSHGPPTQESLGVAAA